MADLYYIDDGYYSPSEGYFVKIAIADAAVSSAVTVTAAIAKSVGVQSSLTSTATVSADVQKIKGINADLTSTASVTVTVNKLVDAQSNQSSTATVSATVTRIQEGASSLSAQATQTTSATKSVSADSSVASAFTQSTTVTRIKDFSISVSDAFAATMTVNAQLAGVALLETAVTLSSSPVVNRATGSTLENIVNLSSQAVKTAVAESSVTSTFTTSAQVNRQTTATATLTSTATLSADAINVQLAAASLASVSTVSTSRYAGSQRPRNITSGLLYASDVGGGQTKYGSNALARLNGAQTNTPASRDFIVGANEDFVFEMWYYTTSNLVSTYLAGVGVGSTYALSTTQDSWRIDVSNQGRLQFKYNDAGTIRTITSTQSLDENAYNHIAVTRSGSSLQLWYNNSSIGSATFSGAFFDPSTAANERLFVKSQGTGSTAFIDEVSYRIGSSTIAGYTQPVVNDFDTQIVLYHFNGTGEDDISLAQTGQASLSSTASVSASAVKVNRTSATLAAQATHSASAIKTAVASATMESAASVTATVEKVQSAEASLSSQFTQTATITRIRYGDSSQSSQATLSADTGTIKSAVIAISSAFTPTLTVIAFKNYTAILDAVSTLTVSATTAVSAQATLTSTVTQSVTIGKITQGVLDANVFFNTSTTPSKFSGPLINTTAEASVSAVIGLRQSGQAALASAATVSAIITRQRPFESTQFSVASTQVSVINVYRNLGDQTFTSAFTQTASVARTRGLASTQSSAFTQTADVSKRVGFVETFTSAFTQSAQINRRVNPETSFASIATQLTAAFYNASGTVLLEPQFTMTSIIGSIKPFSIGVNTGIRNISTGYAEISAVNPPSGGLQITDAGFTISVWARRSNITSSLQPILASNTTGANTGWALALQNDDVYIRSNVDPDEQQIRWNNSIATDYNWHHLFVWGQPNHQGRPDGINRYWHLWVDGVYKGSTDFVIEGFAGDIDTGAPLRLGQASLRDLEAPYTLNGRQWDGDIGQTWVGQITSSEFQNNLPIPTVSSISQSPDRTEFYDSGFVNLGSGQGLFNELPQPVIFSQFESPFSDITFVNTGSPGWTTATKPAIEPITYGPQAQARLSATAIGVFLFDSQIQSQFSVTAQGQINFGGVAALSSQFNTNFQINRRVAPAVNTMTAVATMTTDGVLAPAGGAALFDHSATLTATIGYLRSQASAMSASATVAAAAIVIPPISGDAQLSSASTLTILAGKGNSYSATISASATVTAEATKIDPVRGNVEMVSDFAVTATATRLRPGISIEQGLFTISADVTVIPPIRASAELVTDFGLAATPRRLRPLTLAATAVATTTFAVNKTARTAVAMSAQTTMVPEPNFRTGIGPTTLACEGFTLIAGDIINLDPALTLMITQETRLLRILPESRVLDIEQETRLYKLLKG